jgi:acetyl esterase/lipase
MKKTLPIAGAAAVRSLCSVAGAALFVLLSGCATHRPSRQSEEPVREFAAKGYASVEHGSVASASVTWLASGQPVRLVLSQPARASAMTPVVIYLPGGERRQAVARRRRRTANEVAQ